MIRGLYEVHLPVRDVDRAVAFYEKLGLQLAQIDEVSKEFAFVWIVPRRSWLGLWKHDISPDREPSSSPPNGRHLAFEVDFDQIKKAEAWLMERGIAVRQQGSRPLAGPYARPHGGTASVYFYDPDGNSLEFICNLPEDGPKEPPGLVYLSEWEDRRSNIR